MNGGAEIRSDRDLDEDEECSIESDIISLIENAVETSYDEMDCAIQNFEDALSC